MPVEASKNMPYKFFGGAERGMKSGQPLSPRDHFGRSTISQAAATTFTLTLSPLAGEPSPRDAAVVCGKGLRACPESPKDEGRLTEPN
jgi:hypothetical protein